MRRFVVLLAATMALLASGDTAPERRPTVMLAAVPAPAPTPGTPAAARQAASEPCSLVKQPVLLSTAPSLEPGWARRHSGSSATGMTGPGCAQAVGTWWPLEQR